MLLWRPHGRTHSRDGGNPGFFTLDSTFNLPAGARRHNGLDLRTKTELSRSEPAAESNHGGTAR
jgi:hypothetical protein